MLIYIYVLMFLVVIFFWDDYLLQKTVKKIVRDPRFSLVPHFDRASNSWGFSIYDNYESKVYHSNGSEFFSTSENYVKRNVDTLNELNSRR